MKIRAMLLSSFFAMYIGACTYVVAGSTLELTQKPGELSGLDRESGVAFAALQTSSNHVVIDASIGAKQIHADIDYKFKSLRIRSFSKAGRASISLSAQDIVAFQKLRVSLPPAVDTGSRHGDALTSFVNLIASAPPVALDISSSGSAFAPICNKIGGPSVATYMIFFQFRNDNVTVGPVCYTPPALGRCGASAGPDLFIGLVQRFTQECLNHDQCCRATRNSSPVCGLACNDEFSTAAPGFFFALDCGTTAGIWADKNGRTYILTGGDSSGQASAFSGKADSTSPSCGWNVAGMRRGTNIVFKATKSSGGSDVCPAWFAYSGAFSDCNVANGRWTDSFGGSGEWSWMRTNTIGANIAAGGASSVK